MLTNKPNIVIAYAPKRSRRKPKPAPAIPARIVGVGSKVPELSEAELQQRGDAADRLFQEIKRAVDAPDQPAQGVRNKRTRSGQ